MKEKIKEEIAKRGFDLVGVACADPAVDDFDRFGEWLRRGNAAGMDYLERHAGLRRDLGRLLPGARSVLVAAAAYEPTVPAGLLAAYSVRPDYHRAFRTALEPVAALIESDSPGARCRIAVDTAPILERTYANRAGIGWIGQSTNLVTERFGPYVLLAEIITTLELEPDRPQPPLCGDCGRCLEACPTGALTAPFILDARRCLSYLTIEKRGPFSPDESAFFGRTVHEGDAPTTGRVFGCDLCLEVCPHAEKLVSGEIRPKGALLPEDGALRSAGIDRLEALCGSGFKGTFGRTPIERAGKNGFLRNIAACRFS